MPRSKRKRRCFSRGRVLAAMAKQGLSVQEFAGRMLQENPDFCTPSPQYVKGVLEGKTKNPSADYVFLMAHVLGCTVDELGEVVK